MISSLEIYKEVLSLAKNDPTGAYVHVFKNYYLQLVTTTFYELTTQKNSPLISALCRMYKIDLSPKNFSVTPAQAAFNLHTNFDLYAIVYGLNVALAENLSSCSGIFDSNANKIFRGLELNKEDFQSLLKYLMMLDEALGKFQPVEKIIEVEKRVEVPVEKIVDTQDKDLMQTLKRFADNRHADDEKIINEIKKVQLTLQDELPRLQGALKNIFEIRDGIDYKTLEEPINQMLQLFDKLNETLQRHPNSDVQKGYDSLLKRCKRFLLYVEQSLAMLGAELIKDENVPFDLSKHEITNARPSESAIVSKILHVGVIYKGQVLRKAEVEIKEPVTQQERYLALRKNFGR